MSPLVTETVAHLHHAMRHDFQVIWVGFVVLMALQTVVLALLIRDWRK